MTDGEEWILFSCMAMTDFKSHLSLILAVQQRQLGLMSLTLHYRRSKLGLKMVWRSRTSILSLGRGLHVNYYFNICHVTFKIAQLA